MSALLRVGSQHMNDPALSTNDVRLVQLGIEGQCSKHSETIAGLRAMMDDSPGGDPEQPAPPVVVSFGETHTFEAGTQVSMTAAKLEGWVSTEEIPGEMVKLTVTITNEEFQEYYGGYNEPYVPTEEDLQRVSESGGGYEPGTAEHETCVNDPASPICAS